MSACWPVGSSPLTRGAPLHLPLPTCYRRIIPAHAGSTSRAPCLPSACRDHPRSRGEHHHRQRRYQTCLGSSPLTRGALLLRLDLSKRLGIIPAHAGSTSSWLSRYILFQDHPRSRGEHLDVYRSGRVLVGIIPAHAGSTIFLPASRPEPEDHPRSRGEHLFSLLQALQPLGSSPLTRGARRSRRDCQGVPGIIPAHAGSTSAYRHHCPMRRDHPRSRGEHYNAQLNKSLNAGSSPLTRGARGIETEIPSTEGIIPAHAGSTNGESHIPRPSRDHPRSRGEHGSVSELCINVVGSSPLMRGAPKNYLIADSYAGIIPAHAGSTIRTISAHGPGRDHPRSRGEHVMRSKSALSV